MAVLRNTIAGSVINGPVVQLGSGTVTLAVSRSDYALQWVGPGEAAWLPPHQRTPSYLLDTRREVVPYRSRPAEERRLEGWLADDAPISVMLVHGPGGSGKTRLANAFATYAHDQGWAVAQAVESAPAGEASAGAGSVLVVVDYAERWGVDAVLRMIGALPHDFPDRSVRVLLLARSGATWPALADRLDRLPSDLPEPIELGDLVPPADRPHAFTEAAAAFARALDRRQREITIPDLSADEYGSPLTLHMAALASAYDGHPRVTDLSDYLLRHEGRFWPTTNRADAANTVFLATLHGPLDTKAARELLDVAGLAHLLAWHDSLYPPSPRTALAPLRPDRFGEDFVARHLADHPRAVELLDRVPPDRRGLIVLAAAAERHEHVRDVLFSLLGEMPAVARNASAPVIDLLVGFAPHDVCALVLDRLPEYRTDLIDASARLARHVLVGMPPDTPPARRAYLLGVLAWRLTYAGDRSGAVAAAGESAEIYRLLADDDPRHLPAFAGALGNLSEALNGVGRRAEAVAAAEGAVALLEELEEVVPGVDRPRLVLALDTLGKRFTKAGRVEEAVRAGRRAVALARELTGAEAAPQLAAGLANLAASLSVSGAREEGMAHLREGVAITSRLVAQDRATYLSLHATLTRNLGVLLENADEVHTAVTVMTEALALYRELVADHPSAHLADLAGCLGNLGVGLARQGDKARALGFAREAIGHWSELAVRNPEAHLPNLGMAYLMLAEGQLAGGPPVSALPEALDAALTAADLFFTLSRDEPATFAGPMAGALAVLAEAMDLSGQTDVAADMRALLAAARAEPLNGRSGDAV